MADTLSELKITVQQLKHILHSIDPDISISLGIGGGRQAVISLRDALNPHNPRSPLVKEIGGVPIHIRSE